MRSVRLHALVAAACLSLMLAGSACSSAPPRPYDALTPAAEPLRARFNADAAHVRIVMLVAPT